MEKEAELFHRRLPPEIGKAVPTPIGSMNYNVLRALLEEGQLLQLKRGAEIGVFEGSTSEHLLRAFPDLELLCVDPWLEYTEFERDKTTERMSGCEAAARQKLAPFGTRAKIIKDVSVSAAAQVEDGSLDFVFVDAIHNYEAVSSDLAAWYPKVRSDGLLSGHDYSWTGVREAVEDFIAPLGRAAFYTPSTSDVWFFVK